MFVESDVTVVLDVTNKLLDAVDFLAVVAPTLGLEYHHFTRIGHIHDVLLEEGDGSCGHVDSADDFNVAVRHTFNDDLVRTFAANDHGFESAAETVVTLQSPSVGNVVDSADVINRRNDLCRSLLSLLVGNGKVHRSERRELSFGSLYSLADGSCCESRSYHHCCKCKCVNFFHFEKLFINKYSLVTRGENFLNERKSSILISSANIESIFDSCKF